MTLGENIALRRRSAGLSQEALAGQLGVSRQAVSRWETNESLPDTEKVMQLCRILGVSADELLMDKTPGPAASRLPRWRRWFRYLYLGLGAAGTVLALIGLAGTVYEAVSATSWLADRGRFGDALMSTRYGAILPGGLLLLLLALALLAFDVLLSKRDVPRIQN